jgi:undecaprenyl-diphosphatase
MIGFASLAGRHALELVAATLLIAECIAACAFRIGRVRVPGFDAGIRSSIAVIVVAIAVFLAIAHALLTSPELATLDLAFARDLSAAVPLEVKRFFARLTHLGDAWTLAVCCAGVAAALVWKRHYLLACTLVAASAGNGLLNVTLKHLFQRARPDYDATLAVVHDWSFPSGHTAGSLATYGAIAYVLVRTLPVRWRLPVVCGAVAVVGLVAWSRLIIGVHFASDVAAGTMSSTAWLTACVSMSEWLRRRTGNARLQR